MLNSSCISFPLSHTESGARIKSSVPLFTITLVGQLTAITNTYQTKLTLKGGKAGSASRLDSSLFLSWGKR